MHHVRLIAVSCFKRNLGEAFSGAPLVADKVQAGETAEHLWRYSNRGAEVAFKSTLTHRYMAGNRSDGCAATGISNLPDGCFDLIAGFIQWAQATCKKAGNRQDLLPQFTRVGEGVLNLFDLPMWKQGIERNGLVVQTIDTIAQDR